MEILDLYYFLVTYVGIAALIIGIIFMFQTTIIYQQALDSKKWLSTSGNISLVKVNRRKPIRISSKVFYDAQIEYQYFVNGEEHKGTQQTIGNIGFSFRNIEDANIHSSKFKEGQEVIVYYNPSKSRISSLSIGVDRRLFTQFIFGFVSLCLGLLLIYLMAGISRL